MSDTRVPNFPHNVRTRPICLPTKPRLAVDVLRFNVSPKEAGQVAVVAIAAANGFTVVTVMHHGSGVWQTLGRDQWEAASGPVNAARYLGGVLVHGGVYLPLDVPIGSSDAPGGGGSVTPTISRMTEEAADIIGRCATAAAVRKAYATVCDWWATPTDACVLRHAIQSRLSQVCARHEAGITIDAERDETPEGEFCPECGTIMGAGGWIARHP